MTGFILRCTREIQAATGLDNNISGRFINVVGQKSLGLPLE